MFANFKSYYSSQKKEKVRLEKCKIQFFSTLCPPPWTSFCLNTPGFDIYNGKMYTENAPEYIRVLLQRN